MFSGMLVDIDIYRLFNGFSSCASSIGFIQFYL